MSGNNSLERRCSFNMAQGIPNAESTHNGSGTQSFSWGSISSVARRCANKSSSACFNDEIISNSKNTHVSKIDARIVADVQSNGLTSRIVKYQESGSRLNRSMSAHNLFSKPGQFPTVTLKKSNLPFRAAKRELSMIRIPPPNRSSFYGNTVSSLLRSSSVIGLQCKQNEDLSTENRPIIHPHPIEDDMAPTRSVLDVLKEISRKRINSDVLESEETSKKYCSRTRSDFVDTVANKKYAVQEKYLTSLSSPRRYKRQRDYITSQQSAKFLETNTSPEQAKKRICNYNNDITSSLSSSIKCKTLTAFEKLNQTLPKNFQLSEAQSSKEQANFGHPKSNSKNVDIRCENLEDNCNHTSEASFGHEQNNSAVATQKFASESFINLDEKIGNGLIQTVQKPRLTLFNKKFDDSEIHDDSKTNDLEEKNDDCTGIPFVKPKKIAKNTVLRNPIIERTQKSKLALMLSGLKGELYQTSDSDELDSSCEKNNVKASTVNNKNAFTPPLETTKSIPTLATITFTTTVTSTSNVETPANVKTTLSSKSSPLVGLKLKPSNKSVSNMVSGDTAKNTDLKAQSGAYVLGGFCLGTTSSSSMPAVQSCSNSQIESKTTDAQVSTNTVANITETIKPANVLFTSKDKINEISDKPQLSTNKNLIQFPTVCTEETLSTNSVNTSGTSGALVTDKTFAFVSNLNNLKTVGNTLTNNNFPVIATSAFSSTPVVFGTSTASTTKPINTFNFSIPSTSSSISGVSSSAPIIFGVSTTSATLTKTISTSVSAAKSGDVVHKALGSSELSSSPLSVNLLNFKTNGKSSTSEIEKHSGVGTSTLSYLKAENKDFNCSNPAQFESQCLTSEAVGSSLPVFDNGTNNIFKPLGIPSILGSKSVKSGTEMHESNSNNKYEILVTPAGYGNDNSDKSKSIPFSFISNAPTFAATSSSDVNTHVGGFSFSSNLSNSKESVHSDPLHQTFSSDSVAASTSNFMFGSSSNKLNSSNIFGASTNGPKNVSQGGFSFGSPTPLKTSNFTFGADKAPKNDVINANNSSAGFSFGASADAKQNVLSTNKPFAFGSPQPVQQKQSESSSRGNSFNIFGSTSVSTAQTPAFTFTSGTLKTNATTSIFVPPTSNVTTGPGDRIIRRATRRLQK